MHRMFKRKAASEPSPPLELINLTTHEPEAPNQNLNPERQAVVMMAGTDKGTGPTKSAPSTSRTPVDTDASVTKTTIAIHTPIKLRRFTGQPKDGIDVEDWIRDFQEAAEANQWDENGQAVSHLKHSLDGIALSWYRANYDDGEYYSLEEVLAALLEQFGDARPAMKYLRELQQLKQRDDEPVQDYYCKMLLLLKRAKINPNSTTAVDYLISGLKPSLAQKVYSESEKYKKADELFKRLKLLDEAERHHRRSTDDLILAAYDNRREARRSPGREDTRRSPSRDGRLPPAMRQPEGTPRDEYSDSQPPPLPPRRVRFQQPRADRDTCWSCGSSGHWRDQCPQGDVPPMRRPGNAAAGPVRQFPVPNRFPRRLPWSQPPQRRI